LSAPIIKVEGLAKCYRIRHEPRQRYTTLRDELAARARALFSRNGRGPVATTEDFWALKDVSFDVQPGDAIGIIGRNGAGKSTLLKILSRITEPTRGSVELDGRVASLLEVGTGFHPELTGRENIFLNGAILGMTRAEIRRQFDAIVAFAEVDQFLDTPVKRYSTGMYLRLAFAVAAHLDPEILVVDEVLAVGDAAFQRKCLGKMADVARGGRTVLFVSHNLGAVTQFCPTCVWLDGGHVRGIGPTPRIVESYLRNSAEERSGGQRVMAEDRAKPAQVERLRLLTRSGAVADTFECGDPIEIELLFRVRRPVTGMYCWADLTRIDGVLVWMSDSYDTKPNPLEALPAGLHRLTIAIPAYTVGAGDYLLTLAFTGHQGGEDPVDNLPNVCVLRLEDSFTLRGNQRPGYLCAPARWHATPVHESNQEEKA
jgi:lipopolysaccharide transport system ATP-binding protein